MRENNVKFSERGGGVTQIRKISLQILVPPEKKHNIVFRNKGGQRPFGVFPKIHQNPIIQASINTTMLFKLYNVNTIHDTNTDMAPQIQAMDT